LAKENHKDDIRDARSPL